MPYKIVQDGKHFHLINLNTNKMIKTKYNSKQSAINSGKNFMRFRNEKPILKGNKLLSSK
jgi:hypothetical protein